ncbi:hypothetical protein [Bosea beijingensis]|uniref:hypothetical protein n=1 Tax=Bosea beijingensis TaxID=3068632 RepID=UPI0027409D88|nr:hypothetical protein [Bosea sp. REN20]
MDDWEGQLEAERLMLSTPDTVYDYLSKLEPPEHRWRPRLPDFLIERLVGRNDPLIDLGLARFTTNDRVLEPLWERGDVVRMALLTNRFQIFKPRTADLSSILKTGSRDLVHGMMTNPTMPPDWLAAVISNRLGLSDEAWWNATTSAIMNPRLREKREADTFDEQIEVWEHEKPINAVWDLYLTAEPTPKWANALINAAPIPFILSLPERFMPDMKTEEGREDWKKTATRRHEAYRELLWKAAEEKWIDPAGLEKEDKLSAFAWARRAFAEAYVRSAYAHDDRMRIANHRDQAFRIGYYQGATVDPSWPVDEYIERDGLVFLDAISNNNSLYLKTNCEIQRDVRAAARRLETNHDDIQGTMKFRLARMAKEDPQRYGDQPTEEMLEDWRRQDEEAAHRARMTEAATKATTANAEPSKKRGWFGR